MLKVLFLCGKNKDRSPTAEAIFADWPSIDVASAGLDNDADNRCTPELIAWADKIFVMEPIHKRKLSSQFRKQLKIQPICLNIHNRYDYMDPELVDLLKRRVTPHLPSLRSAGPVRKKRPFNQPPHQ
jgi:predicted protein tyrosine phosphatase